MKKMLLFIFGTVIMLGIAIAAEPPPGIADREYHRQQEQDRVRLQQMNDAQPHVRLQVDPVPQVLQDGQPVIIVREAESPSSVPWVEFVDPGLAGDGFLTPAMSPAPVAPVQSSP